jgi:hypothetical protein
MTRVSKVRQRYGRSLVFGTACALAGFGAGVLADVERQMVVTPIEEARFMPVDYARPDGPQIAVLWGDPTKGPSAMLLRLKKSSGRLHYHSSDYHLVLLQGTAKHWAAGQQEADVKRLGPGSFWFQPGKQAHGDSCLTDECLMFVKWADKRDGHLADEPK